MKVVIRDGRTKDISKSGSYKTLAHKAGKAAKDFVDYAESKSASSPGFFAIAAALADLGIRIYSGLKDRQRAERVAKANDFEKDVNGFSGKKYKVHNQP